MNSVYAYNPETKRFTMEFQGNVYHFIYDLDKASMMGSWDESGKPIARTYKGFRTRIGVVGGSALANQLVTTIRQAARVNIN